MPHFYAANPLSGLENEVVYRFPSRVARDRYVARHANADAAQAGARVITRQEAERLVRRQRGAKTILIAHD